MGDVSAQQELVDTKIEIIKNLFKYDGSHPIDYCDEFTELYPNPHCLCHMFSIWTDDIEYRWAMEN